MDPSTPPKGGKEATMVRSTVFSMALLAPLACGGGGPSPDPTGGDDPFGDPDNPGSRPGDPAVHDETTGTLEVEVTPELALEELAEIYVNATMAFRVPTGGSAETELEAEPEGTDYELGVNCPGYGWASPTNEHHWTTQSQTPSDWTLGGVTVFAAATTEVQVQLCRDLTGRWTIEGSTDTPSDVYMASQNGSCGTVGMPLANFEVLGDQVRPGGGSGDWAAILEDGRRIEYDGLVFVRLE